MKCRCTEPPFMEGPTERWIVRPNYKPYMGFLADIIDSCDAGAPEEMPQSQNLLKGFGPYLTFELPE